MISLSNSAFLTILRGFPHGLYKGVSNLEAEFRAEKFDQTWILASSPLPWTLAQICLTLGGGWTEQTVDDCVEQVLVSRLQQHLLKPGERGSPVLPAGHKSLKQIGFLLS